MCGTSQTFRFFFLVSESPSLAKYELRISYCAATSKWSRKPLCFEALFLRPGSAPWSGLRYRYEGNKFAHNMHVPFTFCSLVVFQVCFWERRKLQLVAACASKPVVVRYSLASWGTIVRPKIVERWSSIPQIKWCQRRHQICRFRGPLLKPLQTLGRILQIFSHKPWNNQKWIAKIQRCKGANPKKY